MAESDIARIALRFANEINRHDVERLVAFMSDDHLFVDALGQEVHGRERLREAWAEYFRMFPDFHMEVNETFQHGRVVAMFGTASGTYAVEGTLPTQNRWKVPAAWRAIVDHDRVVHWQVYTDNEPARKIIGARAR